ncbi:MAG: TonB-dependent receptor [Bacteroidetes bacterium]|nr:MAG: TonB-dependent receptor [Bacteroidota bacterium]
MRKRAWFCGLVGLWLVVGADAQGLTDTLAGASDDVVVTATRTQRKLSNVAVPTLIIKQPQIEASQLRRLGELLQEQTGIAIVNGSGTGGFGGGLFGSGAQLQGMSPDYTLVLINGEPIIGRQGGNINLSRLGLAGIKKIEIVKGPSSSLYGSEAMGGVINIITEVPQTHQMQASVRAGGYGLIDANVNGTWATPKTKLQLLYNRYQLGAIDNQKAVFGNDQDPFGSHTAQLQLTHQFSPKLKLMLYGRAFSEASNNRYLVADTAGQNATVGGKTTIKDGTLNGVLSYRMNAKWQTHLRLYATGYHSNQTLRQEKTGESYYYDDFKQQFYRAESQTDVQLPGKNTLSVGGGFVFERLNTNRYQGIRTNNIGYAFLQNEWRPTQNINVIAGFRYDANQQYASRLSPKLALRYSPTQKLKLTASFGAGFKAPDYRQLYLSFLNNAAGGYSLFGANEISLPKLQTLQQQGFVNTILPKASSLGLLKPEVSRGINVGAHWQISGKLSAEVNLFNNDIDNQIIFDVIALRPNGAQVFSYFNVTRSFTRGIEGNVQYQLGKYFTLSGGYQYLQTGDKDVLQQLRNGNMFGRQPGTNQVVKLSRADYAGLPGRSKHMANAKVAFQKQGWVASLRAIYRSSWGTFDQDGNAIINRPDEMASGYTTINLAASKQVNARWQFSAGLENLLNYTDAVNLPGNMGFNAFVGCQFQLVKNKKP